MNTGCGPFEVEVGATYQHYKGAEYEILHVAVHTETMETLVVYKSSEEDGDPRTWVRPIMMFHEMVDGVPRFKKL